MNVTSLPVVYGEDSQLIVVYAGPRGAPGAPGVGIKGDPGTPISMRGPWQTGWSYASGDAVTWRSSATPGIDSLYLLRAGYTGATINLEPHLHPVAWSEVGVVDTAHAFGAIWEVDQLNHGFTRAGQPVAFSPTADKYVPADARDPATLALGFVREVKGASTLVLQSTGALPAIHPAILADPVPPASGTVSDWELGRLHYVSSVPGMVQRADPGSAGWLTQPALVPTGVDPATGQMRAVIAVSGVAGGAGQAALNAPLNPVPGQLWYRSDINTGLYVWLKQDNGGFWVQTNG